MVWGTSLNYFRDEPRQRFSAVSAKVHTDNNLIDQQNLLSAVAQCLHFNGASKQKPKSLWEVQNP